MHVTGGFAHGRVRTLGKAVEAVPFHHCGVPSTSILNLVALFLHKLIKLWFYFGSLNFLLSSLVLSWV